MVTDWHGLQKRELERGSNIEKSKTLPPPSNQVLLK
jgi:hypothetical protein